MTAAEFGVFALPLVLIIAGAHLGGYAFTRIRQPRVIGEILAGLMLGPMVLGRLAPGLSEQIFFDGGASGVGVKYLAVMGFLYNLGLLLLMFASGTGMQRLFGPDDRREVLWLCGIGTALPFALALLVAPFVPLDSLIGPLNHRSALVLVIGIAVAVTSIPVISRIFHDLGILDTRFARIVLGVAVIEDIVLWGVLAVAIALAGSSARTEGDILLHVLGVAVYFLLGLTLFPYLLRKLTRARWNVLARNAPIAYVATVLLGFTAVAGALEVNLVFGAFLAGYALVSSAELRRAIDTLAEVSFGIFIPVYFAVVGYQLDLTRMFSLEMLLGFFALAFAAKFASVAMGARLAGFRWRDTVNLSIVLNARGGPGIVLASVAYEAAIINAAFYTTLVLTALLTSQAAGAWLDLLLRRGWGLIDDGVSPAAAGTAAHKGSAIF
jgi:Kef-type K+ transport system membrane component KefB